MPHVARFAHEDTSDWGFVDGDSVYPARGGTPMPEALADPGLLAEMASSLETDPIDLGAVRLLAPIAQPPQFIGVGLNYRDHAEEAGLDLPESPVTFGFLCSSVVGEGDTIEIPTFTNEVDWEAELGIVIGKPGRDIDEKDALNHVAGYTIVNDVSARDIQMSEGQWGRSKSFDSFKPMGPWITPTDVLGDASGLAISLWVNDELKQSSTTSELVFKVPEIVSRLSQSATLLPGAVISTGTPHGVGFSRNPPEFLANGDTVTIEIEGIGRLSNPVAAQAS